MENEKELNEEFEERVREEVKRQSRYWFLLPILFVALLSFAVWMMISGNNYQDNRITNLERKNETLKHQNQYNVSYYYNKCTPVLQHYLYDTYTNKWDDYILYYLGVGNPKDTLIGIMYNKASDKYYGIFQVNGKPDYHYTMSPHLIEE